MLKTNYKHYTCLIDDDNNYYFYLGNDLVLDTVNLALSCRERPSQTSIDHELNMFHIERNYCLCDAEHDLDYEPGNLCQWTHKPCVRGNPIKCYKYSKRNNPAKCYKFTDCFIRHSYAAKGWRYPEHMARLDKVLKRYQIIKTNEDLFQLTCRTRNN